MKNKYQVKVLNFLTPSTLENTINITLSEYQERWWNIKDIKIEKNDKVDNQFIVIIVFYQL